MFPRPHTHTIASTIIASVHDGLITANRRKPQLLPPIDSRREEKLVEELLQHLAEAAALGCWVLMFVR